MFVTVSFGIGVNDHVRIVSIKIMDVIKKNNLKLCSIRIECKKDSEMDIRNILYNSLENNRLTLESLEKNEITKDEVELCANIITNEPNRVESVVNVLSSNVNIIGIKWAHFNYKDLNNEDEDDRD